MDTPEQLKFSPTSAAEPERVSRSGRKIKPKRFLDEEVGQEEELRDRRSFSDELPRKMAKPSEDLKKVATVTPIDPDKSGKRSARISSTETKKAADKSPMVGFTDLFPPTAIDVIFFSLKSWCWSPWARAKTLMILSLPLLQFHP